MTTAWEALKESIVYFRGQLIGTVAAVNESREELDYDQVFMRDFVPSALAFLMKAEPLIMKNFLLETARLQSREKMVDLFKLGQGVMPASFKVHHPHPTIETLLADFGEIAIGRVAPVDSGLWWIFLLNAYTTYTEDKSLSESPHCQRAMRLILKLWLSEGSDTSTALLCSDGCSMIYHRMVFMRDFIPSALAFLMKAEPLIMKNFLLETARLQSREKMVDLFKLGQGVMPASFKVHHPHPTIETLLADFGEIAIGRVAPVDSGLWWIFLLNAYTTYTEDKSLSESPHCQRAMRLILKLWLSEGSDTSTALLCSDGCSMIYRRMGIYGYPLEIQALVFMALRYMSNLLLKDSDDYFFRYQISKRIKALSYHLQSYYWLDFQRLNDIYRYKTEEYSETALNKFNVIPESIPDWIFDSMPSCGGYFIGNVSPARMDFRWFCLGKFIGIMSSPATGKQVEPILDRVEERWEELIGGMTLKICYPGVKNQEGQRVTGCLPKNGGTNDDLLSRRKGLVKSAATYSGRSVTGNAKTMKKSCRSAPRWSVIHLATVLLIFLSTACMASATGQRCEVASLATNIRLFCSSNNPSSLCCEAVNAAMGSPDGKICLCLVGESPEILTMGFSSQNLIRLQNLCQQYDEEFDCDQSNTTELNHERTGIRESADEHRPKDSDRTRVRGSVARHHGDKEPPHHREGHRTKDSDRTGARDSVAREHSDEESPHHGNHRPKTPKSNLKDRKSRSKETSSKEDEQQKAVHSDQRPQQHDHTDPHTSGIIGFLSGFIVLLVSAMVIVVVVLKYKRQRIDFRQLLSVALAAALAQVPSQEALAAQRPFPVQGPPPPIDRAETVNGVPVPQVQVPPPLAIFPGPLEIVSMLGCIMVDRMRHRLWT